MPARRVLDLSRLRREAPARVKAAARWLRYSVGSAPWEYLERGWATQAPSINGWTDPSILRTERAKWPLFQRIASSPTPFVLHEDDVAQHNNMVTFSYVLARAAHKKDKISLLDWGGGVGHYALVARGALPEVEVDYHCKDVDLLCGGGRELLPSGHFYEREDDAFARTYDLVVANDSLMLSEDWDRVFARLAAAATGFLYVALPVVLRAPKFVVVQRAKRFGFDSEFKEWFLNRRDVLDAADRAKLTLVREFVQTGIGWVHRAPEQGRFRGFLFRPAA